MVFLDQTASYSNPRCAGPGPPRASPNPHQLGPPRSSLRHEDRGNKATFHDHFSRDASRWCLPAPRPPQPPTHTHDGRAREATSPARLPQRLVQTAVVGAKRPAGDSLHGYIIRNGEVHDPLGRIRWNVKFSRQPCVTRVTNPM